MKKYKISIAAFAVIFSLSFAVLAAEAVNVSAAEAVTESVVLADEAETLEGVAVAEPTSIPSGFGFWWNDLKENLSLALTFDLVKKAEKQLLFAARRVKLAEYMMENSADAKVQEKAQQLLARANEYTQKIQERKDELAERTDSKAQILLANAAKQQMNLELALDKIEDKIPAEKLAIFQQWRTQIEAEQQQFLDGLKNNSDVPRAVKDKITEIKARIQVKLQERETFRSQQKEILDEIKAGREDAKAALEMLREERVQALETAREEYKDAKAEIIDKINSGDQGAVKDLLKLNQTQKIQLQNVLKDVKTRSTEIKTELKQTTTQSRQEIQNNRTKQRTKSPSPSPSASL